MMKIPMLMADDEDEDDDYADDDANELTHHITILLYICFPNYLFIFTFGITIGNLYTLKPVSHILPIDKTMNGICQILTGKPKSLRRLFYS